MIARVEREANKTPRNPVARDERVVWLEHRNGAFWQDVIFRIRLTGNHVVFDPQAIRGGRVYPA